MPDRYLAKAPPLCKRVNGRLTILYYRHLPLPLRQPPRHILPFFQVPTKASRCVSSPHSMYVNITHHEIDRPNTQKEGQESTSATRTLDTPLSHPLCTDCVGEVKMLCGKKTTKKEICSRLIFLSFSFLLVVNNNFRGIILVVVQCAVMGMF